MNLEQNLTHRISRIQKESALQVIGGVVIAIVVFVTYYTSVGIGFWTDDYQALDLAGRLSDAEYLVRYFDPRAQTLWYRPMVGLFWKIGYIFFRAEPSSFHLVQVFLHLVNCLLLYRLTNRITRKWKVGFIAALIYATLPLASMAVYWTAVHDPLAMVFYLSTLLFWLNYLETKRWYWLPLTYLTFVGALLSKEVSVTLPVLLFLMDRWLIQESVMLVQSLKRYAFFVFTLVVYVWFEWMVSLQSAFTQQIGYTFSPDNILVFLQYLSWVAFPWEWDPFPRYVWLFAMLALVAYLSFKYDRRFLFLAAVGIMPVFVLAPIPSHLFNPRYLYPALMASVVGLGLLLQFLLSKFQRFQWAASQTLFGLAIVWVVFSGSMSIFERVENHAGFIRQERIQYRPIYQRHATFPSDTFLYFIDSPLQTLDVSGLMFLRYGANVTVSGIDRGQLARLREHRAALVYYLDDENQYKEIAVETDSPVQVTPHLPVQFEQSISFIGFEVVRASIQRGEPVVILLYWRAAQRIPADYKVFAHLVAANGANIAGYDSRPMRGRAQTTTWKPNQLVVDAVVVPVDFDAPVTDNFRIEVGLYEQLSGKRLSILDATGQSIGNAITIQPFRIAP